MITNDCAPTARTRFSRQRAGSAGNAQKMHSSASSAPERMYAIRQGAQRRSMGRRLYPQIHAPPGAFLPTMRTLAVLLLLAAAAPARAADPRFPDAATRKAVVGCWDAGAGVTLALSEYGKHSVWAKATFLQRPKGGPKQASELA